MTTAKQMALDALKRAQGCILGLLNSTPVRDADETLSEVAATIAALEAELAQVVEPVAESQRQEAYASIDRLLRNHLYDEDYACFSESLETVYTAPQPAPPEPVNAWQSIDKAPRGDKAPSILLACEGTSLPIYCGRLRYGNLGEPQMAELAWRCDSSGRFATPTEWAPLPPRVTGAKT